MPNKCYRDTCGLTDSDLMNYWYLYEIIGNEYLGWSLGMVTDRDYGWGGFWMSETVWGMEKIAVPFSIPSQRR